MIEISPVTSTVVIGVTMALLLLAGAFGHAVMRLFGLQTHERQSVVAVSVPCVSIVFGATVVSLMLYLASLAGALTRTTIGAIVVLQVFVATWHRGFFLSVLDLGRELQRQWCASGWVSRGLDIVSIGALVSFLVVGLLWATLPASDADSATTYLNAANLFLRYGELINVGNFVGNMGKTGFLLLIYGMGAHSAMVGHALLFSLAVVGVFGVHLFVRYITGAGAAGFVLVAIVTSFYAVESIMLPAKFDGTAYAWSGISLVVLGLIIYGERRQWAFVVLGACVGFLAGMSYNNVAASSVTLLALLAVLLYYKTLKYYPIAIATAVVASAPTFIQNILLFGNPVFPFASGLFQSGLGVTVPVDGFAYQYISEISQTYAAKNLPNLMALPFALFQSNPVNVQARYDPWLGSLLLISILVCLAHTVRLFVRGTPGAGTLVPPELLDVAIAGTMLTLLFWAFTQHILRYFSAGLPFSALLCALGIHQMWLIVYRFRAPLLRYLGAVIVIPLLMMMVTGTKRLEALASFSISWIGRGGTESNFIAATFIYNVPHGFGPALEKMRSVLEDGDKVLSFITGNYYFGDNVVVFSGNGSNTLPSDHGMTKPLSDYRDWREWEADLRSQKFNYLVINSGYLYLSEREKPIVNGYLINRQPAYAFGNNLVFRIQ